MPNLKKPLEDPNMRVSFEYKLNKGFFHLKNQIKMIEESIEGILQFGFRFKEKLEN